MGSLPSLPEAAVIRISLQVEDLVSNPEAFTQALEEAMTDISRATGRSSSYWARKVPEEVVRPRKAVQGACYNLCKTFLSISEDKIASKRLIRFTGDDAELVLDALQLVSMHCLAPMQLAQSF